MNNLKTFIFKYLIILLGFVIFVIYIWNRFIRERTSKDLPLNLNIIYLFILIYICVLFSYIIYSLIFPKKTNIIVENIIELLFTPLKELDIFIKSIPIIETYYYIIIIYLFQKVEDIVVNSNKFFYMFWLFPRLVLLIALYVDVFVFHRFHYKYMVILFGLLLFFNKYLIYSLKYYKKQTIDIYKTEINGILTDYVPGIHASELGDDYEENENEFIPTMTLPFEDFVEFQTKSMVYNNIKRSVINIFETKTLLDDFWLHYIGHVKPDFFNKTIPESYTNVFGDDVPHNYNKAYSLVQEKIQEHVEYVLQSTMRISLVVEHYKKTSNQDFKIRLVKIFVYSSYLICWLYVLFISAKIYTISYEDITMILRFLGKFQDNSDNFQGSIILEYITYKKE